MQNKYKISLCIVNMNRLHHLMQTLPVNLSDNLNYDNVEFVLLDYNSKDGMEDWAKENMQPYISSGSLVYYRTCEPAAFSHSHSKNIAFRLATGDVVCNINADNYTGKGFAAYVNRLFSKDENICITPIAFTRKKKGYAPPGDVFGKVCVRKCDFLKVQGFSEQMHYYGFEDYDFTNRLEMAGIRRHLLDDRFFGCIRHDDSERYPPSPPNIRIFYSHLTPSLSTFLLLHPDGRFDGWTLKNTIHENAVDYTAAYRRRRTRYPMEVKDFEWLKGDWKESGDRSFCLIEKSKGPLPLQPGVKDDTFILHGLNNNIVFSELRDVWFLRQLAEYNSMLHNRNIMQANLRDRVIEGNQGPFGKAKIYKNFSTEYFYTDA